MKAEDVDAALVERAVPEVLALFEVCALDSTEEPNAACVYCRDDAEALTRAALAAVVPEIQAQALRDAADYCTTKNWTGPDATLIHLNQWLRGRAVRLTATTEETTT